MKASLDHAALGAAAVLLVTAGCGVDTGSGLAVSGAVTFDGQPLTEGSIAFRPLEEGKSEGASISEGEFKLPAGAGLTPGRYRVEITANRPTGETEVDVETGRQEEIVEQFIPRRYNWRSELVVDVTADGDNNWNFELNR